jgi:hypothetical protein
LTPEQGRALAIMLARHSTHAMQNDQEVPTSVDPVLTRRLTNHDSEPA